MDPIRNDYEGVISSWNMNVNGFYRSLDKIITTVPLNEHILLYLLEMGLKRAAEVFMTEGNFNQDFLTSIKDSKMYQSLENRQLLNDALFAEDVDRAIRLINTIYPNFLSERPLLYVKILLLKVAFLLRNPDVMVAINYLNNDVSRQLSDNEACLSEIQKYSYIIFKVNNKEEMEKYYLGTGRIKTVARELSHEIILLECPGYHFHHFHTSIQMLKFSRKFKEETDTRMNDHSCVH